MPQTRPTTLPVWAATGDVTQPQNSEITVGWPDTAIPPARQRFNWILNFLGNGLRYLLQYGIPEWETNETYPAGARVQVAGVTYRALLANTGSPPAGNPTNWILWASGTLITTRFVATAGQTVFAAPYSVGGVWVTRNGVDVEFTGTNGTSITLNVACNAGDIVFIRSVN